MPALWEFFKEGFHTVCRGIKSYRASHAYPCKALCFVSLILSQTPAFAGTFHRPGKHQWWGNLSGRLMLNRAKQYMAAEAEQVIPHFVAENAVAITEAGLDRSFRPPRVFSKMLTINALALRNQLYRLLASKGEHGWILQKPTEADLFCPPWYYWRHHPAGPHSRRDDAGNVIE